MLTRPNDQVLTEFHGMATRSPQMQALFETLTRVAQSEAPVLIRGETGTGKELCARALHALGPRRDGPFRAINCATLTPELLASELFGHVRGAFTGAVKDRRGLFALAHRGTIFLDEIAELPLDLQARLLRVLQERSFVPVGGTDSVEVDVRILSATHKALRAEAAAGRFRHDLMYRVRVVPLYLPRLAERDGDVEALTWRFIEQLNGYSRRRITNITPEAMDLLLAYHWPGNVRELRNVLEHAYAIGLGVTLVADDLTPELRGEGPRDERMLAPTVAEQERAEVMSALSRTRGRKAEAAALLGISRATLWRKMREMQLNG